MGTMNMGLFYKKRGGRQLIAYLDSDFGGDIDDYKSITGSVFMLSSKVVSWTSKNNLLLAYQPPKLSILLLLHLPINFEAAWVCAKEYTIIWCDNNSSIKLSKNPILHGKSKHIDIRYHFLLKW